MDDHHLMHIRKLRDKKKGGEGRGTHGNASKVRVLINNKMI
jgi:hypothetical protein